MFDSGFGGLTVARATIDLLPAEDLVYIGDTGRYPYGSKPLDEVRGYAHQLAWSLVNDYDAKAIVVACNTATAAGLDDLRRRAAGARHRRDRAGARALVQTTVTGRVGVIGTVGTMASGAYLHAVVETGAPVALTSAACPGFVEFVERGQTSGDEVMVLAERLLAPDPRGRRRRPAPRLHPLPVPRPHDQRCHGTRGHARELGRRDGVRGDAPARRTRPAAQRRADRAPSVPVERRHRVVPRARCRLLGPELDHTESWRSPA